jgi:large subunit ribosomal protein L4e
MKIQILNTKGEKVKEMTTNLFEEPIREDIIAKVVEAEKLKQPYSPRFEAGMDRSASGLLRKTRHVWKSNRGKGLSRIPRKIMSRRGTQFNWIGAIIPSARGGRRAHPPKGAIDIKKINKKEMRKALLSALSYANTADELRKKYTSLKDKKIDKKLPLIVEDKILPLKTKEFLNALKNVLGEFHNIALKKKAIRPGIGKMRGRKNKQNAGLLFVTGNGEEMRINWIDSVPAGMLRVSDLAGNGARLTLFTENAIKELEKLVK